MTNNNNNELNKLVTQNLTLLSLCNFDQYNNTLNENQYLKAQNIELIINNNKLKNHNYILNNDKNKLQHELYIRCILPTINKQNNKINNISVHNKIINTVFKINNVSYSKEEINGLIKSINTIKTKELILDNLKSSKLFRYSTKLSSS